MAKVRYIQGWGLWSRPDEAEVLGGRWEKLPTGGGCTSETCNHVSHDPAASDYRWWPDEGDTLAFGAGENGSSYDYYRLTKANGEVYYIEVGAPFGYWQHLGIVSEDAVPEVAMRRFDQEWRVWPAEWAAE